MGSLKQDAMGSLSISEQAARWSLTLQRGGAREHREFAAWLRESPQHVREYLLITALDRELGELDLAHLDVNEILARANRNIVPLPEADAGENRRAHAKNRGAVWKRFGLPALAAALALLAIGLWRVTGLDPSQEEYATTIGEQRVLELADGTVLQLNPVSRVQVHLAKDLRQVTLLEGEAIFTVRHDPARPFQVFSGRTLIEDIGTQFRVHRRATGTTVSVMEGAVDVSQDRHEPVRIVAGEQARISLAGAVTSRSELPAAELDTSRKRHLTFSGDTLAEIAADFNRYNRSPQIRIESAELLQQRYSGGFDADDPESLVEYLKRSNEIEVVRQGDEIVIRSRPPE